MKITRIYQGRVSRAETPNDDGSWRPLANWEAKLWQHHCLFQDAVNYYLLALLGMAKEVDNESNQIDHISRVFKSLSCLNSHGTQTWNDFRRCGASRKGMRESIIRTLNLPRRGQASPRYCVQKIYGDNSTEKIRNYALQALMRECSNSNIQQAGRSEFPKFCDPNFSGTYNYDLQRIEYDKRGQELPAKAGKVASVDQIQKLAREIRLGWVAKLKNNEYHRGEEAREQLQKAVQFFRDKANDRQANFQEILAGADAGRCLDQLDKRIRNLDATGLTIPKNRKCSLYKKWSVLLFKFCPDLFTLGLLKTVFPERGSSQTQNPSNDPISEAIIQGDLDDDPIRKSRGNWGYVFRSFTAIKFSGHGSAQTNNPQWKEFDIAAFKEAITILSQVKDIGDKRDKEKAKLEERLRCMNNEVSWNQAEEDSGEASPPVLVGDPRIKRLEQILQNDLEREYDLAGGQTLEYPLRRRTIRSFAKLREKWIQINKRNQGNQDQEEKIIQALRNHQKELSDEIGSIDLFTELAKKQNWLVWQECSSEEMESWRKQINIKQGLDFSDDPIRALVEKQEIERKIKRLEEPVQFTPADACYSPRHFRFSDMAEFNKKTRGHRPATNHDFRSSIITDMAVDADNGRATKAPVRLHYSAPRLLRDYLRDRNGKATDVTFMQPMMRALGESIAHDMTKDAVQLMPHNKRSARRFLLNFSITLNADSPVISEELVRLYRMRLGAGTANYYLRWPKDSDEASKPDLWWNLKGFQCLAIDLGQRNAGAYAIIRAHPQRQIRNQNQHHIGTITYANNTSDDWYASVKHVGMLRLPGENLRVSDGTKIILERYGKRGRKSKLEECEEARDICEHIGLDHNEVDEWLSAEYPRSFPEDNDVLLLAFQRAQKNLYRAQSVCWQIKDNDRKHKILQNVKDSDEFQKLLGFSEESEIKEDAIYRKAKACAEKLREALPVQLTRIANRILPLKTSQWEWRKHPDSPESYLLQHSATDKPLRAPYIQGQRGLSFPRLEQIDKLRRRAQSLNRALMQVVGEESKLGVASIGTELPDVCPEIGAKLEHLKEQRINQTAHMILAQALGLRLTCKQKKKSGNVDTDQAWDIHGEYEKMPQRTPVDFIVLENLSRYLTSQDRPRRENSRLMKWCHRALLDKLKELAEMYGIPIVEVNPAYSSRFCSKTGVVGFRAVDLSPQDEYKAPWKYLLKQERETVTTISDQKIRGLFDSLKEINENREGKPPRTLIAPLSGGPLFVSAQGNMAQADINAAINIGMRAIVSPECHQFQPRIKTEFKAGKVKLRKSSSRDKQRWSGVTELLLDHDAEKFKSRYPNFFMDYGNVANYGIAEIEGVVSRIASAKGLFGTLKEKEWSIADGINDKRRKKWGCDDII